MSQVPVFAIVAADPVRIWPGPVQVVVPPSVSVREIMSLNPVPLKERPPAVLVTPAPVIPPEVQLLAPDISTVSVPSSVPPDSVSTPAGISSPLENVIVPPDTVRGFPTPTTFAVEENVAVPPPLFVVLPVTL